MLFPAEKLKSVSLRCSSSFSARQTRTIVNRHGRSHGVQMWLLPITVGDGLDLIFTLTAILCSSYYFNYVREETFKAPCGHAARSDPHGQQEGSGLEC